MRRKVPQVPSFPNHRGDPARGEEIEERRKEGPRSPQSRPQVFTASQARRPSPSSHPISFTQCPIRADPATCAYTPQEGEGGTCGLVWVGKKGGGPEL